MSEVLTPRSIETKSGPTKKGGTWTLYRVEFSDGTKAATFDAKIAKFVEANYGKPINVEIAETEKGKDLAGAWPLDGEAPAGKARVSVEKSSRDDFLRPRSPGESRIIAKQACLKAAVELVVAMGMTANVVAHALAISDEFVEWVLHEDGVRPIVAPTRAQVTAEREAIVNDRPASDETKARIVSNLSRLTPDAKATLISFGIKTVKDINEHLTQHVAELVDAEQIKGEIPF